MSALVVTLPLRLVSEPNARVHWATKAKRVKAQRTAVRMCLGAHVWGRVPCRVLLTRIGPNALDGDNLAGACKAVRDAVAAALGVDDRDPRVAWEYAQRRAHPDERGTMVRRTATRGNRYGVQIRIEGPST